MAKIFKLPKAKQEDAANKFHLYNISECPIEDKTIYWLEYLDGTQLVSKREKLESCFVVSTIDTTFN